MMDASQHGFPDSIAGYAIERELGSGASGRVYLARETNPPRHVALKTLVQLTPAHQRRFERETEVLAGLEHPNIARLYDAGETRLGDARVAWLAMAYIQGQTLDDWAADARPTPHAVLRLIAVLARAMHFAHTRGVVHRDLKPANVLICKQLDSSAAASHVEPIIVDFGVAHVAQSPGDATAMTQAGQVIGTLAYMSYEQLTGARVDGRSDVYALGVMAYELIAGQLPFPQLSGATLMGALETLQRGRPERLSQFAPAAKGDIETMIGTAMAQDPARRYGSAAEFAADIERYLDRRPIEARKPTLGYTAGLFIRRNKAVTAAAALVVLTLVGATGVSLNLAAAERAARVDAQTRLAQRDAISQFLRRTLVSADPNIARGQALTVNELVDRAQRDLRSNAAIPDSVRAQLNLTLARTLIRLGDFEPGVELLDQLDTSAEADADVTAEADRLRADVLMRTERLDEADTLLTALEARGASLPAGTRALLAAMRSDWMARQGDFGPAVEKLASAYAFAQSETDIDPDIVASIGQTYAQALRFTGQLEASIRVADETEVRVAETMGSDAALVLQVRNERAQSLANSGDLAAAITLYEEMVETSTRVNGPEHPSTAAMQSNFAQALLASGQAERAVPVAKAAFETARARFGMDSRETLNMLSSLAWATEASGDAGRAQAMYEEAAKRADAVFGADNPAAMNFHNNLGVNLQTQEKWREMARVFEALIARAKPVMGADHPQFGEWQSNYAAALIETGQARAAQAILARAILALEDGYGVDHPRAVLARQRLAKARAVD